MIRCTRCIYPQTRPDSHFDAEGVCSGCRSFEQREHINWPLRLVALKELIAEAKARRAPWDVVVPVSGGKDSTYQCLRLIELGAKVLAVNSATDLLSEIGRRNLDNLKRYCDVIEITPNTEVRKKLVRLGLYRVGDLSWPEHNIIWAAPTRVAVAFEIPLCVWGEQPQREYSSPEGVEPATNLNSAWVHTFGGMLGMRLSDCVGEDGITERDLDVYRFPSDAALDKARVKGIWLGDWEPWDGWRNAFIAQQYGFECLPHPVEQSLANFENLDNLVTVPRDWLRKVKHGYGRATDIACNQIRRGRITRDECLKLIERSERFPQTSLGVPLAQVLGMFDITFEQFVAECDRWTNPSIFEFRDGKPVKSSDGTPVLKRAEEAGSAEPVSYGSRLLSSNARAPTRTEQITERGAEAS